MSPRKVAKSEDDAFVLNPATGRYVSKTGAIGKKITGNKVAKRSAAKVAKRSIARVAKRSIAKRSIAKRSAAKRSAAKRSIAKVIKRSAAKRSAAKRSIARVAKAAKRSIAKRRVAKRSIAKVIKRSAAKRSAAKRSITKKISPTRSNVDLESTASNVDLESSIELSKSPIILKKNPNVKIIKLSDKSWIEIHDTVIKDFSLADFMNDRPEKKHKIMMYGRLVDCPRYVKLYGKGSYNFSGTSLKGDTDIPSSVEKTFEAAKKVYPNIDFNGALVNWYMNGDDYISAHSDDEKDLVNGSPILSFSFGAERNFRIRDRKDKKIVIEIPTTSNSLIIMCGDMQKEFTHEIPKTKKVTGPRINVTIRAFKWK